MKHNCKPRLIARAIAIVMLSSGNMLPVRAAEPAGTAQNQYNIPAGALGKALSTYASSAGVLLAFAPDLTTGKITSGLKGSYRLNEGFAALLKGTGLEVVSDGRGGYQLRRTQVVVEPPAGREEDPAKKQKTENVTTETINVRAQRFKQIGPMPGLNLTKEEIPGNVQSLDAKEIKDSHAVTMAELLNSRLQSVNVNDYQGNPFQMDVTYRGFTASPQIGTPQGLSVFMDGIRVNEPFGDIVNWDLIPMNALAGVDVFPGSNPIFGLNTLGGAIAVRTKNGFDDPGTSVDVLSGAWGRKQILLSTGGNNGVVGGFLAINKFEETGWRNNSPSKVNQIFGKASYRSDKLDLHGSVMYAGNDLIGNGLVPMEMYKQDSTSVFTSPDQTKNELLQYQIAGAFQVNDAISVTGQVYRRKSNRHAVTGDINRDFANSGDVATRRPTASENPVCAYSSTNAYGIPDYYVVDEAFGPGSGLGISNVAFAIGDYYGNAGASGYNTLAAAMTTDGDFDGNIDLNAATFNQTLPAEALEAINAGTLIESGMFHGVYGRNPGQNFVSSTVDANGVPTAIYTAGYGSWVQMSGESTVYWTDATDPTIRHFLVWAEPINGTCGSDSINSSTSQLTGGKIQVKDASGNWIFRNGAVATRDTATTTTGYIDGTPTSVITDSKINQLVKGGNLQLNLDTGRHKFMLGGELDHATDTFTSWQMLGMLTADRKAYLAANEVGAEYTAAGIPVYNNIMNGSSLTRSLYASETFNPTDALHFSASARYNHTRVMSNMRVRKYSAAAGLMDYQSLYMDYLLCTGLGLSSCDSYLLDNPLPNTYITNGSYLSNYEKEAFTYHKLNPAFGVSWSPRDNLNLYANWNQGTRTPSAIELGCAFDHTLQLQGTLPDGTQIYRSASLINKRACTLPTAMSGDPYLPQVVARTLELGARGKLANGWDWNASVYRTIDSAQ